MSVLDLFWEGRLVFNSETPNAGNTPGWLADAIRVVDFRGARYYLTNLYSSYASLVRAGALACIRTDTYVKHLPFGLSCQTDDQFASMPSPPGSLADAKKDPARYFNYFTSAVDPAIVPPPWFKSDFQIQQSYKTNLKALAALRGTLCTLSSHNICLDAVLN